MSLIDNAEALLSAASLNTGTATVKGRTVHIRELSLTARDEFSKALKESGQTAAVIVVVQRGAVKPDGSQLLTADQARQLGEKSADFVQALATEILKFSGLDDDEGNDDGSTLNSDSSTV
jgi:hypothetical protein